MSSYRLAHQAKSDLRYIWDYIGQHNQTAADRMIDGLFTRLRLLARNPDLGEGRDDLHPGLRAFVFKNYLILYYPMRDGIEVAGIVNAAQDLEGQFRRGER